MPAGPNRRLRGVFKCWIPSIVSAFESLRRRARSVSALLVLDGDGGIVARASVVSGFDVARFAAEYATLLRILRRTSEDAGTGSVTEHMAVSGDSIVIARQLPSGHFAVAIAAAEEHLGRLRYELRLIEGDLDRALRVVAHVV